MRNYTGGNGGIAQKNLSGMIVNATSLKFLKHVGWSVLDVTSMSMIVWFPFGNISIMMLISCVVFFEFAFDRSFYLPPSWFKEPSTILRVRLPQAKEHAKKKAKG